MLRRTFLAALSCVAITGAALSGCTKDHAEDLSNVTYKHPRVLEVALVDHETAFADAGAPYLQALAAEGLLPSGDIELVTLPSYGRHDGVTIESPRAAVAPTRAALEQFFAQLPERWQLPSTHAMRFGPAIAPAEDGRERWGGYVVRSEAALTAPDLVHVKSEVDEQGLPGVSIALTQAAAQRFGELTGNNVGRKLAISLDGEVLTDPVIASAITGGMIRVNTAGSTDEHDTLARTILDKLKAARAS